MWTEPFYSHPPVFGKRDSSRNGAGHSPLKGEVVEAMGDTRQYEHAFFPGLAKMIGKKDTDFGSVSLETSSAKGPD